MNGIEMKFCDSASSWNTQETKMIWNGVGPDGCCEGDWGDWDMCPEDSFITSM